MGATTPSLSELLARHTREGELYERLEHDRVRCVACGHRCLIPPGREGVCRVRFNDKGTLRVPFGYASSTLRISDAEMFGSSLGLTAQGSYRFTERIAGNPPIVLEGDLNAAIMPGTGWRLDVASAMMEGSSGRAIVQETHDEAMSFRHALASVGAAFFTWRRFWTMPVFLGTFAVFSVFFFFFPAMLFSGFIFPIANMPAFFQWLSLVDPLRYMLVIIRGVFLKGVGFEVLWTQYAALLAMGLLVMTFAVSRFHKTLS